MANSSSTSCNELRAVLVGSNSCGKNAIDSILRHQKLSSDPSSVKCEMGSVDVGGRRLTLVNAPGWWRELSMLDTAELYKANLLGSLLLCQPGPHVFILVVELDLPFREAYIKAVEQHLQLFGDKVWAHTIVVFNDAECLKGKSLDDYLSRNRTPLRWFMNKCGHRYHVFDRGIGDAGGIALVEQIEEMVRTNEGRYFECESSLVQTLQDNTRMVENKAQERERRVATQRARRRALLQDGQMLQQHLEILLLGWVHSGKSSTANTILGFSEFKSGEKTLECSRKSNEVAGRQVAVMDTPGWWKYFPAQLTPDKAQDEMLRAASVCSPAPNAILLVIPVDTSFTTDQKRIIQDNMKRFGENVWKHTMVLFTWGQWLAGIPIEQHIEREGEALCWLMEKCGNRYHVLENKDQTDRAQVTELLEKIEEMVAGNCFYQFAKDEGSEEEAEDINMTREADTIPEPDGALDVLERLVKIVSLDWESKIKEANKVKRFKCSATSMIHPLNHFKKGDEPEPQRNEDENKEITDWEKELDRIQTEQELPDFQREQLERECGRLKMILEREWSRREFDIVSLRHGSDESSEPDQKEITHATEKCTEWDTSDRHSGDSNSD